MPRPASTLRSALSRPAVIQEYLNNECTAGHMAGPLPLADFVVNPLRAVPRRNRGSDGKSCTSHTPLAPVSMMASTQQTSPSTQSMMPFLHSYDAMDSIMHLGRDALMAKLDIKSAFQLYPVRPADHHLLGMRWQGQYFFDRVLPFGLRSAPCIFNCLAIEWIAKQEGSTTT